MSFIGAMNVTLEAEGSSDFHAPGPGSFELPAMFHIGDFAVTKPMGLLVLSAVLIVGFTYLSSRKAAMVPGRLQFAGEAVYGFVRNSLARDNIGSEHFMRFVPYLFSLFMFILVNNYYGVIPLLQFPSFSRIGFVVPLALIAWVTYIGVGIWKHGALGYLKHATMPGGVRARSCCCSSRWSSSPTCSSGRSRSPCVSSATCSPATSC